MFTGCIKVSEIRNALAFMDLEDISTLSEDAAFNVEEVEIDQSDINAACGMCGGDGVPEPESTVDPNLIADFIAAVRCSDIATARALVDRVFVENGDARVVDAALCRCAP